MSLIDEFDNKNTKKCIGCKNVNIDENSIIEHCEQCFNKDLNKALSIMKNNNSKLLNNLEIVNNSIKKLKNELATNKVHLSLRNKYEIDILNLEGLIKKTEIDIDINKKAFEMSQKFANDIRKKMNWKEKEIEIL